MSIKVMQMVWERLPMGGTELMVALKCADFGNDNGESIYPSVRTISRFARVSESQGRRAIRKLEREGWLQVIGNHQGGASTRQYRLNVAKLQATPSIHATPTPGTDATPCADATPSTGAPDPLHGCAPTPGTDATQTKNRTIKNREGDAVLADAARRVLSFLNEKAGRKYPEAKPNVALITGRLKEGYSEEQLRMVVVRKVREWGGDEKMHRYLRPSTLFRPSNLANYVGELGT